METLDSQSFIQTFSYAVSGIYLKKLLKDDQRS